MTDQSLSMLQNHDLKLAEPDYSTIIIKLGLKNPGIGYKRASYLLLSIDFAQSYQTPTLFDQSGDLYFENQLTFGFFGINNEAITVKFAYLLREERSFTKSSSTMGSKLHEFIIMLKIEYNEVSFLE